VNGATGREHAREHDKGNCGVKAETFFERYASVVLVELEYVTVMV
jgi:hypothetical protein